MSMVPGSLDPCAYLIRSCPTRVALIGFTLAFFAATPATAQQAPRVETSIGYLALTAGNDGYPKGYYVDFVANVNSRLGVVVATDGAYRSQSFEYLVPGGGPSGTIIRERVPVTLNTTSRGFMGGGRLTWREPRVDFFVQASGGAAHLSAHADVNASAESAASLRNAYHTSRWRAAVQAGGGANIAISSRIGARVGVDYRRLERVPRGFIENEDRGHGPNQVMFTLGVRWMFGS